MNPALNYSIPPLIVVDDFYVNPDEVRNFALKCEFHEDIRYHKGKRTHEQFRFPGIKERFEALLGVSIPQWDRYGTNGIFQYCTAKDPIVYHQDTQQYAGTLYLTPDAPVETGSTLIRNKASKLRTINSDVAKSLDTTLEVLRRDNCGNDRHFYDRTLWEDVDRVGNIYNRLVLWNAQYFHAASGYFGLDKQDGRLFQLFFFDVEPTGAVASFKTPQTVTLHEDVMLIELLSLPLGDRAKRLEEIRLHDKTMYDRLVEQTRHLG